jgi:hypothetical protein
MVFRVISCLSLASFRVIFIILGRFGANFNSTLSHTCSYRFERRGALAFVLGILALVLALDRLATFLPAVVLAFDRLATFLPALSFLPTFSAAVPPEVAALYFFFIPFTFTFLLAFPPFSQSHAFLPHGHPDLPYAIIYLLVLYGRSLYF